MKGFLKPASTQQRLENWYLGRFYQGIAHIVAEKATLTPESVVVEFGCDLGVLAHYLSDRCRLILSDLSDRRETPASRRCPFHQARAEASGLPPLSVDVIVLVSVYHHLSDFDAFTREAVRLLKPHGKLVLVEPIKHHPIIMFLNLLSKVVHAGDPNLTEPYGLALWINESFIKQRFSEGFHLVHKARLDNFLWGLNPFVPRPVLRMYDVFQRTARFGNSALYIFEKNS